MPNWKSRIVGYGEVAPDSLLANEANWRIHPQGQRAGLAGVLRDVGVVQNIIVNRRTASSWGADQGVETLVDGHLRVSVALSEGQPVIPVTYVDLEPHEERLILATLDPLGALAATDAAMLDTLLRDVTTGDAAVQTLLAEIAANAGIVPPDFEPAGIEEQGRLDQKAIVTCPHCGETFVP